MNPGPDPIDWLRVLPPRLQLLRRMHENFCRRGSKRLFQELDDFTQQGGEALESHARFEALDGDPAFKFGPESGWQGWPADLRDPSSPALRRSEAPTSELQSLMRTSYAVFCLQQNKYK